MYNSILLAFIFAFKVNASSTSDSITLKKIEKLFSISKGKYDSISYRNFHLILSESKKIEALTYEMESYKSLAWFHGSSHNKRRLDSVLFYFYKFESKILELNKSNYPDVVGGHYLNKGNILANRFGLTEIGLQAYN